MQQYLNREEAGKILALELTKYKNQKDAIVLALPRGGVPVAFEIAKALGLPLDVFIVRKIGVPGHVELAMGAIATGGVRLLNNELIKMLGISESEVAGVIQSEQEELMRREHLYRNNQAPAFLKDKTILLVDDGIATGATMKAALQSIRQKKPKRIIIATPVAPLDSYQELEQYADELICPNVPSNFMAVGLWYQDFTQTTDEEVYELLKDAQQNYRENIG